IEPCGLLFETGVMEHAIKWFEVNGSREDKSYKAFFKTAGDYPFDIFAASFYLLSRYEEYLPHQKDIYGRYAHQNSLAFKENVLPSKRAMQDLIQQHSNRYSIGIHPSWQSGDDIEKLKDEILRLGQISGKRILTSRQHFIRFTLPATYRRLSDFGIESDFSMG